MGKDAHISEHPRVNVAVDSNKEFRFGETLSNLLLLQWHRKIEFVIYFRSGMDIVQRRIRVANCELLPGLHRKNIRLEETSDIIQHRRGSDHRKASIL